MNELKNFHSSEFGEIRTLFKDGQPWFVAVDVCRALEISNSRDATARLDADEKGVVLTDTLGGKQQMQIVNEAGLYTLILGSRKPEAKAFKRWITHEVIPAIRQHGAYMTPETIEKVLLNPDFIIGLATNLKAAQDANRELAQKILDDAPKVAFANSVTASSSSILIGDLAKLIRQNGVEIGQNRLFKWMRDNGYLIGYGERWNMPTQRAMEMGLFEIKETTIGNGFNTKISLTTKVTGKGQTYFIKKLLGGLPCASF